VFGVMKYNEIHDVFSEKPLFTRSDFIEYIHSHKPNLKDTSASWLLYDMCKKKMIERISYNAYRLHTGENSHHNYSHDLSDEAIDIINFIKSRYPEIIFIVWETRAYNEFTNHQVWRNFIFVEVEKWLEESVFNALYEHTDYKVLYKPNRKEITVYSSDVTVSVLTLTSEAPVDGKYAKLEKMLVDLFANSLIDGIVNRGDYPGIFKEAFLKYNINYKMMLRYARRRGKADKISCFMENSANINMVGGVPYD
jgi:hypothetical protein